MNHLYGLSMDLHSESDSKPFIEPVSKGELNSWRRGFTPQAEIWNGRMAMVGLATVLVTLLSLKIVFGDF